MAKKRHSARPKSAPRKKATGQSASGAKTASAAISDSVKVEDHTPPSTRKNKTGIIQFFSEVRSEGSKVTWTSLRETQVSTIMVVIFVALASIFFFLADQVLRFIIPMLLNLG